jgi:hypothetical protein
MNHGCECDVSAKTREIFVQSLNKNKTMGEPHISQISSGITSKIEYDRKYRFAVLHSTTNSLAHRLSSPFFFVKLTPPIFPRCGHIDIHVLYASNGIGNRKKRTEDSERIILGSSERKCCDKTRD